MIFYKNCVYQHWLTLLDMAPDSEPETPLSNSGDA